MKLLLLSSSWLTFTIKDDIHISEDHLLQLALCWLFHCINGEYLILTFNTWIVHWRTYYIVGNFLCNQDINVYESQFLGCCSFTLGEYSNGIVRLVPSLLIPFTRLFIQQLQWFPRRPQYLLFIQYYHHFMQLLQNIGMSSLPELCSYNIYLHP